MSLYTKDPLGPSSPAKPSKINKLGTSTQLDTSVTPKKQIRASGRNVKKLLHGKTPRERAKIAAKLVTGEFAYVNPTVPQASRVCVVAASRIHAELGHQPKAPSDAKIDRIIAHYGADVIMRGLDRHTAPRFAFAAE